MDGLSKFADNRRFRWCLALSVALTTLCFALLGLMLRPGSERVYDGPRRPFLIALYIAPPRPRVAPAPRPIPKPPKPNKAARVRPLSRPRPKNETPLRRATLRAPSPKRNLHPTHRPRQTTAGGASTPAPVLAAAPAPPTLTPLPAPPSDPHILMTRRSAIHLALAPPAPMTAPTSIPALPATVTSGGSGAGAGHGPGIGTGTGSGEGHGAGSGSGGPFGLGSGGQGGGEGARHIVYVLDISGSMTSRIDRVRQEMDEALDGLKPGESFDILTFSNDVHVFSDGLNPATPEMISRAKYFLSTIEVNGGTNLEGALQQALFMPGVNVVYVMTDGVPTQHMDGSFIDDRDGYMSLFPSRVRAWNINRARIYTVGLVGKDPDGRDESFEAAGMLQQISRDSGGVSKIVTVGVATPE